MTRAERITAWVVAAALLAVLCVAAWLTPSPAGHGTHEQLVLRSGLGLRPCSWLMVTARPCPTCGMTTAFAHAANGDILAAAGAQPMGAALALLCAAGFWVALHAGVTGSPGLAAALTGRAGRRTLWAAIALLVGAWVYKLISWQGL
jgi:hypothetical protein